MNYCHGGDVLTYREQYGRDPLDFSANINPLGMPQPVQEAVRRSASRCAPYPDPCCRALTAALAEKEGLPPGQVLVGNGAADLIFRLAYALRPRRALLLCPGFAEYEAAGSCWSGSWKSAGRPGRSWWWTSASAAFWTSRTSTP